MDDKNDVVRLSEGEIVLWVEDERVLHLKAISPFGDPVELGAEEARHLAEELLRLAAMVE